MKWLLLSICVGLFAVAQVLADDSVPKIKKMDPAKQESIRTSLQMDISKGADALRPWFGQVSICAPRLWSRIASSIDRKGVEIIPTHFPSGDGAAFKGGDANRRFADQMAPLLNSGKVRIPKEDEVNAYWRICPFDEIEEPFFVVAAPNADVLVHLQWDADKGHYLFFFLEAFRIDNK